MLHKTLVTYASRTRSTAEVAEAIGQTLSASGAYVDVVPMNEVQDLSPYQMIVAGSPIRGSKWLPEAVQFVHAHRTTLAQKRVAIFTVCITMAMKHAEKYRAGVMDWVAPVRALVKPVSEGLFAGKLDFSQLPIGRQTLMLRLMVALSIFPGGDHRDWNAIRAWAQDLKPLLNG